MIARVSSSAFLLSNWLVAVQAAMQSEGKPCLDDCPCSAAITEYCDEVAEIVHL